MELLTAALVSISILFLIEYLSQRAWRRASALSAVGMSGTQKVTNPWRARLGPFINDRLTRLGSLSARRPNKDLEELIIQSSAGFSLPYLQGLRAGMGLAAALLVLPLGLAALPLSPAMFALGYHLPVVILKRKSRMRWERLSRDLPEMVDLMAVLCYSGESLFQALQHSSAACDHLSIRDEIEAVLEHVRLGESTAEALRHMAHHPCREMRRFSRTLLRADEYGAPIAETLEELAAELRSGRREKERVRAARASVLILFPLVFLILPSFLLLTVGGMILGYTI
jgi:Flp pilus assembly protein TadB